MTRLNPTVLWFRQDLRLADNPALIAATERGAPILPLFILDDDTPGPWRPGGASRWWLHRSLAALARDLYARGARLILRRGRAEEVLPALMKEASASAVLWNRCYEPFAVARDTRLKARLKADGIEARSFDGGLLCEPWTLRTKAGEPFKVFTPFWNALRQAAAPPPPRPAPEAVDGFAVASDRLDDWDLLPKTPDWSAGLREAWRPGETGAQTRLAAFLDESLADYGEGRNRPDRESTSRLSPHLHWGEIGHGQVWHATLDHARRMGGTLEKNAWDFLREVGWREFSINLLYHWPDFPERPWKPAFEDFPWRDDEVEFQAWCRGRTGYPIVDAGLRELWTTGWMHNRVRMIAASFLVKDLLVPWQRGEAWFWDTLVDADLASNAASWQWVAGCGADAAPYFRIFNPVLQGEKFDPEGAYVRRWLPELAQLPDRYIHRPWEAPDPVLAETAVELGRDYPHPIVDHAAARDRALAGYDAVKRRAM